MGESVFQAIRKFFGGSAASPAPFVAPPPPAPAAATPVTPFTPPTNAPLFNGAPIPSYPDKGQAVPAVPPAILLESQRELIDDLQRASGMSHEDFQKLLLPAIESYAAYVHLLPASEAHHHCGQGGLLRHGIECAFYAALKCESAVFALDHPPSTRKHLEPRWRAAAMLGAMLHDTGKPLVDVGAIDGTGDLLWNPHTGSLYAWIEQHRLEYYQIHWRPGARHKRHEAFTPALVYRIVPATTMDWLGDYNGQEAVDAMMMALSGSSDPRNPLAAIIKSADSASVSRDIQDARTRQAAGGQGGSRGVAARIVRAIHDKIEIGEWIVNSVDAGIYRTTEGLLVAFPAVAVKAIQALRDAGETSIPNEPMKVLEILNDHGFLKPNVQADGTTYMTWQAHVTVTDRGQSIQVPVTGMLFTREELIPNAIVPPAALHVQLLDPKGNVVGGTPAPAAPTAPDNAAAEVQPAATTGSTPSAEPPAGPTPAGSPPPAGTTPAADPLAATPAPIASSTASGESADPGALRTAAPRATAKGEKKGAKKDRAELGANLPLPEEPADGFEEPEAAEPAAPAAPAVPEDTVVLRNRQLEGDLRDEQLKQARADAAAKDWPPANAAQAQAWFEQSGHSPGGLYLVAMANRVQQGQLKEGRDVFEQDGHLHARFRQAVDGLGIPPAELHAIWDKLGWIVRDPRTPTRGTVEIRVGEATVNAIRFSTQVTEALRLLLPLVVPTGQGAATAIFPLGPYIGAHTSAQIRSKSALEAADSPHFRLAFGQYAHKLLSERMIAPEAAEPAVWRKLARDFAKQHGLVSTIFQLHLMGAENAYLVDSRGPGAGGDLSTTPLQMNTAYNEALDQQAAAANVSVQEITR
ncbi:MobH family relaxase [Rhodanobacter denitrificans]|uniref:MobH family relaxase n=1 Tax=Rhodanobacter denitrificans TaxID=666685 RepID=UPI001F4296A1|nr:MobH family relaxase [Rhodanobacter denitrificans]UJJ60419.1 TraI domain-containing protein [Rhodanobacter denitrificans]